MKPAGLVWSGAMEGAITQLPQGLLDGLFRSHNRWLMSWLRRQPWGGQSAEDLASDVFLSLLRMPNLEAVREPRAMMTTIARRLMCDARRRNDLKQAYLSELTASPEALSPSAEDRLIMIEALQAIDRVLATLTPKSRLVFLRCQIDGASYAEVAEEMKLSVSMVRKHFANGLRAVYHASDAVID